MDVIISQGIAMYACLHTPTNKYESEDKEFKIDLLLSKTEQARLIEEGVQIKEKTLPTKKPYKPKSSDADKLAQDESFNIRVEKAEETINLYKSFGGDEYDGKFIQIKRNAINVKGVELANIPVFDTQKVTIPTTTLIGNGSLVNVQMSLNYDHGMVDKWGTAKTLLKVQVVDLVAVEKNDAGGFDIVPDGYVAPKEVVTEETDKGDTEVDALFG